MATKTYQIAVHGAYDTNCFIHADADSGHCFLIDPGAEAERLLTLIHDHAFTVEKSCSRMATLTIPARSSASVRH